MRGTRRAFFHAARRMLNCRFARRANFTLVLMLVTKIQTVARGVLVTGGTGAIGSEIVRALSKEYLVTANFTRDEKRAFVLKTESGCALQRADVGQESEVEKLFEKLPPLFAVVHAAGLARDELMVKQRRAAWDETLRVNCHGAFLIARAALEKIEDGGRLIFIASRVGERGRVGQSAYAASKAAVMGLMKCAAREGAARKITVNAICPGFVPSAMNENLNAASHAAARRESVFDEFGTAQQVAGLVLWLLNVEAAGISGQVFHVDSRL